MCENGFFVNIFDFNHDGKLDLGEKAAEFMVLDHLMKEEEDEDDEEK